MDRGILMTPELIRQTIAGNKTETRRLRGLKEINAEPSRWHTPKYIGDGIWQLAREDEEIQASEEENKWVRCPYGVIGDRLYIKEAAQIYESFVHGDKAWLKGEYADGQHFCRQVSPETYAKWQAWKKPYGRKRSLLMFKELARIWLEITGIRLERLQEITEENAIAEGLTEFFWGSEAAKTPRIVADIEAGKRWWNHVIVTRGRKGSVWDCPIKAFRELWDDINACYGWEKNPWTWAIWYELLMERPA